MAQFEEQEVEKVETILRRLLSSQRQGARRADCITDEVLAGYLSRLVSEETQSAIEAHVATCSSCAESLVAAYKAGLDSREEIPPQPLVDKATALVPPKDSGETLLDVVVRLVLDSVELVTTTGRLVSAAPAAGVRGRAKSIDNGILQVEKELGEFKIAVEVERTEGNLCQVAVRITAKAGSVVDTIRLSLMAGERERASYLVRQGTATFDRIPPGDYRLKVSDSGHSLGAIRLTIKEEHHER